MLSDKTFNKKISDILRNRSRNRSHFAQPFPKAGEGLRFSGKEREMLEV